MVGDKFKKHKEQCEEIEDVQDSIKELIKKKSISLTAREHLVKCLTELKRTPIDIPPLEKPTGEIMTEDEFKEIIAEHTGYLWKPVSLKETKEILYLEGYKNTSVYLKEEYGLDVEEKYIKIAAFHRNENSRDELYLMAAIMIPGHIWYSYSTGRVDGCAGFMPNDNLAKQFKTEV